MPELQGEEPGTMKGTDLTISGDLSDYSGDFNKTGGTITIGTESASAAGNDTENNCYYNHTCHKYCILLYFGFCYFQYLILAKYFFKLSKFIIQNGNNSYVYSKDSSQELN